MNNTPNAGGSFGGNNSYSNAATTPEQKLEDDIANSDTLTETPRDQVGDLLDIEGIAEDIADVDLDETENEEGDYEPDVPNTNHPNGGEFRWSDLSRAVEFTRLFMESPRAFRDSFRWVLNMSEDTSSIQILKRLQDLDGSVWALRYTGELVETINSGSNDFMATIRLGVQLSQLNTDLRRSLFRAIERTVEMFPKDADEEAPRLRYRVNMDDEQFIQQVIGTVSQIDHKASSEFISRTMELVTAWTSEV